MVKPKAGTIGETESLYEKNNSASEATEIKRRLDDITRLVSDWVWESDADYRLAYVSDRVLEQLGFHPYELLGRDIRDFGSYVAADGSPADLDWRSPFRDVTLTLTDRTGAQKIFLFSGLPVFNIETGTFEGFRGTTRDITERKVAEGKLNEIQRELAHLGRATTMGEMAAGLAHELNQPLTAIANYAEGMMENLRSGKSKPDELFAVMELVSDQALRAGEIVHKMCGYVDRTAPKRKLIDVHQAIREAMTLMEGEMHLGGVKLDLNLSDQIPEVNADRIQVEQVVLNLARNAIEAMVDSESSHRQLMIGTTMIKEDTIEIAVADIGPGVPPGALEQIFDAFYTTKENGLGMGLSISRSIAEAHGGALWATMEDGTGTTFHFTLSIGAGDKDDRA